MVLTLPRESYYENTKALISLGRNRGYVLIDELNDFLPPSASSPAEVEMAMALLNRLGVGVGGTVESALANK